MHPLSIACLVMAALAAYTGVFHLVMFARRRHARQHLPFALLCLCVSGYDIGCVGLYSSHSVAEGIVWQRLQIPIIVLIATCILWFGSIITEQRRNRVLRLALIWFAVLLAAVLVLPERYTLSAIPLIRDIGCGDNRWIVYYEGNPGPLFTVVMVSVFASYFYLFYLLARRYRETRSRGLALIMASQVIYVLAAVSDALVALDVYTFIYVSEYAFFVIVLAMAYALMRELVDLDDAVHESNRNLEQKVEERTLEIRRLNEELHRLAELDGLTGIYNRRFFDEYLEIEMRRAHNEIKHGAHLRPVEALSMNFGLAILDVDDFKRVNDGLGHQAGDRVLVDMVELIRRQIFTRDVLCRYGGEEFALILTKTAMEGVLLAVEKIRKEVEAHPFAVTGEAAPLHLTVSIGVASFDETPEGSMDGLIRIADRRLLAAKAAGKNRVVATG